MDTRLSPTQQRIYNLLADGQAHTSAELLACLYDEMGARQNIQFHLSLMRKLLRPIGQDIICQRGQNGNLQQYPSCYRLIRHIQNS